VIIRLVMQSGELPDQMVLDSNDESWFAGADEAPDGDFTGADFPLRLGKNLTGARPSCCSHRSCWLFILGSEVLEMQPRLKLSAQ
jgi:hypothetical protein